MGKDTTLPKNWPPSLPYLTQPSYSPRLTPPQHLSLRTRTTYPLPEIPAHYPRGPSPLVRITPIADPSHPAHGQCGLYTSRALAPGSLIVPYYGVVHRDGDDTHSSSDYDLWLDRDAGVAVDAARAGNEARFVNDYRGVRGRPNAEFRECWDARTGERCMGVFVLLAGKKKNKKEKAGAAAGGEGIAKGEEILVSYGKGFWGKRRDEDADDDAGRAGV
ncbi:hypothetical protein F4775DRAFT_410515 [Biscogniauxia sp. FL1348]|nr:hypothetical protein F4775DRAFT_410515 [Biscogniauxia sp. FL1348]